LICFFTNLGFLYFWAPDLFMVRSSKTFLRLCKRKIGMLVSKMVIPTHYHIDRLISGLLVS
jgi:hypothetical protein